jgi:chemotaxis protein histidine kinase CheA
MNASKKVFSIFENKTMEQTATKKKALFKSSQIASYLLDNSSSDESTTTTTTKAKEETKSIKIIEPFNKNPFCEKPKKAVKLKQPPPPLVTQTKLSNTTTKKPATKAVADVSILDVVEETHKRKELDANKKDVNKALELVARLRAEKEQQGEHHKQEVNKVLEYATKLKAEQKLKEAELNINKLNTNNSLVSEEVTQQAKSSQDSISSIKQNKTSFEYDTEEVLEIMNSNNDDDDNENEDEIKKKQTRIKPKRDCEYEAIDENLHLEAQIDEITSINLLNQDQIEYMVLRDINYFIDIFSGNCVSISIYIKFGENILTLFQIILIKDHSWRHIEFKKYSKKSGNLLYCNTALTSYTREQYSAAVQALQNIFCKKDNKVNFD